MITNIDKIIETDLAHPIIKKAARKLKKEQYFMPSEFFTKLTRHDSEVLGDMASIITDKDIPEDNKGYEYQNIILLASILSMAEGVYLDLEESVINITQIAAVLCIANNLHRKGLVKCNYENMTFGPEGMEKVIMEKFNES